MNTRRIKLITATIVLATFAAANAQKPKASGTRTPRTRPASGYSSGYTTGSQANDTSKKKNTNTSGYNSGYSSGYGQKSTNNAAPAKTVINANIPVEVVKGGTQGGIGDSVRPSLRTDNTIDRQLVKDRTPLTYEHLREDDVVYKEKVWREIDTREKMNLPFRYAANEDNGNQRFINILYNSIQAGEITVFNGEDDRFTTPLTKEQVSQTINGGNDTVPVMDMSGEVVKYEVRSKQVDPDSIYRYKIKEEWTFDKESSRMFVRILGIAPVMKKYTSSGVFIADQTLFWAYYPDLRPTLARFEVYNGKNYAGRMSWEELFESRFFASRIIKSTIDNPFDQNLASFIKDPLFRLLEGENIKDKIFNYEQDLWSY